MESWGTWNVYSWMPSGVISREKGFIAVKRHHGHGRTYKRKLLLCVGLHDRGLVYYCQKEVMSEPIGLA